MNTAMPSYALRPKCGHGNVMPEIGDVFHLKVGTCRGRPGFVPAHIKDETSGARFDIQYSIRSSASLAPFEIGQVWQAKLVRYKRLSRHGEVYTIARIDLLGFSQMYSGMYDSEEEMWMVYKYLPNGRDALFEKIPATVRHTMYAKKVENGGIHQYETGVYAEIVRNKDESVIYRFKPRKVEQIPYADLSAYELYPCDSAILVPTNTLTNPVAFIRESGSSNTWSGFDQRVERMAA